MSDGRRRVLDAVVAIVEREGVGALTFESVAAEAGVTRSGVVYHFRSKRDLLLASVRHLAQRWNDHMVEILDGGSEEQDADQRLMAYLESQTHPAPRAALQLLTEMSQDDEARSAWMEVDARWAAPPQDAGPAEVRRFVARLAAQGLWFYQVVSAETLTAEQLHAIAAQIIRESPLSSRAAAGTSSSPPPEAGTAGGHAHGAMAS